MVLCLSYVFGRLCFIEVNVIKIKGIDSSASVSFTTLKHFLSNCQNCYLGYKARSGAFMFTSKASLTRALRSSERNMGGAHLPGLSLTSVQRFALALQLQQAKYLHLLNL